MNPIPDLSDSIAQISDLSEQIKLSVNDRHHQLEALASERAALLSKPIGREDYIRLMQAQIDIKADLYKAALSKSFLVAMRQERATADMVNFPATVSHAITSGGSPSSRLPANARGAVHGFDGDANALTQLAASYFLRDELKLGIAEAIDDIEPWPFRDAIPLKEALERIREIDREMLTIESELALLGKDAHKIGLALPANPVKAEKTVDQDHTEFLQSVTSAAARRQRREDLMNPQHAWPMVVVDGLKYEKRENPETGEHQLVRIY